MKKNLSPRDLENLSAYLDGELNAYSFNRMKNRIAHDPNLGAALDVLRETKSVLQHAPKRRAPRNFSITPQMLAKSTLVPRSTPVLNYAAIFAVLLLFFALLLPIGFGMGGGAMAPAPEEMAMEVPAAEEPAAEEAAAEEPAEAEVEAEEEYALAGEEIVEEAADVEDAPVVEEAAEEPNAMDGDSVSEEEASTPRAAPTGVEKSTADEQVVENTPLPTLPTSAVLMATPTEIPESLPSIPLTFWLGILLALIIILTILGVILRRRKALKRKKESGE